MIRRIYLSLLILCFCFSFVAAQDIYPSVAPEARYVVAEGEIEDASMPQSAPVHGFFTANADVPEGWIARYEWRIYREGKEDSPIVKRFDGDIDYTFMQSGTFFVQLYVTFTRGDETIGYPAEGEASPFMVSISESKLEMPNAFSPNGDGYNDVYKAKDTHQSIVSFQATVFNRWGQKLYSWNNIDEGWDGTYRGSTVKNGTYYVVVVARGADGREYKIKKDVNVLTGYQNNGATGGMD